MNDFYQDENGNYVLTEEFLLRRGSCCKNGCKHCPCGFDKNLTK